MPRDVERFWRTTQQLRRFEYGPRPATLARVADAGYAPIADPVFTGDPQAPTPPPGDGDTSIATTAFVTAAITAAPNQTITLSGDISGSGTAAIVTTLPAVNANVGTFQGVTVNGKGQVTAATNQSYLTATTAASTYAPLASPVFTGAPSLPAGTIAVTPATADNDTSVATTAYVQAQGYATTASVTTADNLRVLKAGDTMTGNLVMSPAAAGAAYVLNKPSGTFANVVMGQRAGLNRWEVIPGNTAAETGSNAGSDFSVGRYSDAGAFVETVLLIERTNGNVQLAHPLGVAYGGTGAAAGAAGPYLPLVGGTVTGNVLPSPNNGQSCGLNNTANGWFQVVSYNFVNPSGAAQKADIELAPPALNGVMKLAPKVFRWRDGADTERRHHGFIAEDVRDVFGEEFGGYHAGDGSPGIAYSELTAVLWRAVQELAAEVAVLRGGAA